MASVNLVDDQAAFDLVRAVIKQAIKDTKYKRVQPEDRASAKAFLGTLEPARVSGQHIGKPDGQHAGRK